MKTNEKRDVTAFLAEARKRFDRCVDATSENRKFQLDDIKFAAASPDNGWQWPPDVLNKRMKDPNGARPTLTVNKLPQHIRLVTNEQRKNKPAGKVLPVDDQGDPEVAEVLNGVIRHIEVSSHADVAHDTACENQVTIGEGYWRILTDYVDDQSFEQDIRVAPIKNSFSVYLDPDALKRDSVGRLCEYGFITERMPTAQYEREFPKAKSKADWEEITTGDDTFDWFDDEGVMIAEYFYIEYEKKTICQLSDGQIIEYAEGLEDMLMTQAEATGQPPLTVTAKRQTQVRTVKWCKVNGIEVLEESEWAGKYIPIVRVVGNEWDVEGKLITSGIVRNAKDPQRMVNYWTSQEAEMLALAPKAPFIGAVGQFETMNDEWRDANITNYSRLEYDPIDVNGTVLPPPQRQIPPLPPAGIISAKMGSADDLQATVGQYNPSLGAEAKEKSGRAIVARQQQADVGTFHYIDNLSRAIAFSTEIILDLIPKIYDTQRVARIIGEDGEPDHCQMCVGMGRAVTEREDETGAVQKIYDPSVGRYDVVVTVGPSYTTKRIEAVDSMIAITQASPELWNIIGDLIVKNMDWNGADEIAKRLKKMLPPQLQEDENANPADPEQQMKQVQMAAQQLGEKEAQLNAAAQQIEELSGQAQEQEAKAKEATLRAQAKVDEINSQQEALVANKQTLELTKRLAEEQLRNKELQNEAKIKEAVFTVERMLAEHARAVRGEIESTAQPDDDDAAPVKPDTVDAILQSTAETAEAVRRMVATLSADRTTELLMDDDGNPIGSRSRLDVSDGLMQ